MTIEGMQADAVQLMSEDDGRTIVAVVIVEGKAMDNAVQRGHNRGAGGSPDIDAEVQSAGLFGRIEMFASGIQGPVFIITSDAIAGVIRAQRTVDIVRKTFGIGNVIRPKAGIGRRKIEGIEQVPAGVEGDHRMKTSGMPGQNSR